MLLLKGHYCFARVIVYQEESFATFPKSLELIYEFVQDFLEDLFCSFAADIGYSEMNVVQTFPHRNIGTNGFSNFRVGLESGAELQPISNNNSILNISGYLYPWLLDRQGKDILTPSERIIFCQFVHRNQM